MSRSRGQVLAVIGEVDPAVVSGGTRSLLRAVPELERRGWRFTYWTEVPSATERELASAGAEVHGDQRSLRFSLRELRQPPGIANRLGGAPRYLARFGAALRAIAPDVVIGNTVGTLPELAVARLRGYRTLLHVVEILPERPKYRLATRLLSWAADEVLAPSAATAGQFERIGREVHVAHTGIEVPESAIASAQSRQAADSRRPVVAGTIGTICKRKGTDVLVAAAELLRERDPEIELRLCGRCIDGAERAEAEVVLARGLAAGIEHHEHVDVFEELPQWDMLVMPSRQDPFPNVVLEAMAIGVPVIATRVGGLPEMLAGGAGVLVEPEDPWALAQAILELAADPDRRMEVSGRARERATTRFTVHAQAEVTEAALEAMLGRRR